jgi:phage N-6-adenine-methyltransferase
MDNNTLSVMVSDTDKRSQTPGAQGGEWGTPPNFYQALNREFHFTLDPCASDRNHKCERYFTKEQNGLSQSWENEVVFCNPPYGKSIPAWITKGAVEAWTKGATVVFLIHARTDTQWYHRLVIDKANEVRFVEGRLTFISDAGARSTSVFPSVVVIFRAPQTPTVYKPMPKSVWR